MGPVLSVARLICGSNARPGPDPQDTEEEIDPLVDTRAASVVTKSDEATPVVEKTKAPEPPTVTEIPVEPEPVDSNKSPLEKYLDEEQLELYLDHGSSEEGEIRFMSKHNCDALTAVPKQVFSKNNLQVLSLVQNDLYELPAELKLLVNLKKLVVNDNQIAQIPIELFEIKTLEELDVSENQITVIPPEIGNLSNLNTLLFYKNQLTRIPDELGNCTALEELNLFNNKILKVPKSFQKLVNMRELNVASNKLFTLPDLSMLKNLERLASMWCRLIRLPPVQDLPKLDHLQLFQNPFDSIELNNLTNLKELDINDTSITEIPEGLKASLNLEKMNVRGCKIKVIPTWIGELKNLETLNIGNNDLTDKDELVAIPIELADCVALKVLLADNNPELTTVPEDLKKLKKLMRVDIRETYAASDDRNQKTIKKLEGRCSNNGGWCRS